MYHDNQSTGLHCQLVYTETNLKHLTLYVSILIAVTKRPSTVHLIYTQQSLLLENNDSIYLQSNQIIILPM